MTNEPPTIVKVLLAGIVGLAMIVFMLFVLHISSVRGRDLDGRYANSPLHEWFNHLASGKGLCCSFADGTSVADADWRSKDGHYQVRLDISNETDRVDMEWVDVPDDAVITEPNRDGRTMVWPLRGMEGMTVRCFMPGSMT